MSSKLKIQRDPRGHSLRIYSELYDSPAFAALSAHDVMAYLALLRELKGYNNGDLSLPLTRAKRCGVKHHVTLARSLRALCAVGLVALTRKGGCTKGGQRLPNLYRVTDRECFDIPAKCLTAKSATNEWKRITTVMQGLQLIESVEAAIKKSAEKLETAGHGVTATTSPHDVVSPTTTLARDPWPDELGHPVTMAKKGAKPATMRVSRGFSDEGEKAGHRTPHIPPIYVATPRLNLRSFDAHGGYQCLRAKPKRLFTNLIN